MKKLVFVLIYLFCCTLQAAIQAVVDTSQVNLGDTLTLTITDSEPQNGGVPDLTPLEKDFAIFSTERNVNYTVINGQAESVSQWIISLKPLKSGTFTIPSIKMGSEQSNPIIISVRATSKTSKISLQGNASQQQDVILKASVDTKKPYINQEIIYTVTLYNSKRLLDAQYQGPRVEDALLIPLGDARRYQTLYNNKDYAVEEQRYAIFPQKSGMLKIESPVFTALVYDFNPQRIRAEDKTASLSVQPIPSEFKGTSWFPAKQVTLTEKYEYSNQTVTQGSTLTRVITLEGVAVPAQLLPNLAFQDSDAFNVYPEKGADKNKIRQGELIGSTEFKVTYLFNKAGKTVIPELKVYWYNTKTGQNEVATLAPRSFDVTASLTSKPDNVVTKKPIKPLMTQEFSKKTQEFSKGLVPPEFSNTPAWYLALFFGLAWIFTVYLWFRQKKVKPANKRQIKHVLTQLHKACKDSDKQQARNALLKWGTTQWPDAYLLNLSDLSELIKDGNLKKQIHKLSEALYKEDKQHPWRGDDLYRAVQTFKYTKTGEKRQFDSLPPINPMS